MKVFLGSSSESLDHLGEVATWLEEAHLEPVPWNLPTLFPPGASTFHRLIEISKEVDAAVFIFAEDDRVWYREGAVSQPRDNVLLEYGLFVGALGPRRAIVCRRGKVKAATDLQGINWVDSSPGMTQRARVQLKAWAAEVSRTRSLETGGGTQPNSALACVVQIPSGLRSEFRNTDLFVHFGMLQSIAIEPSDAVIVLPANEFFDERCFDDTRTATGAFIKQYFPTQARMLQQFVGNSLRDTPVELVERAGRPPLRSFGVGTCVYLDHPLGSTFRLIFAAVASDRPPDGLRTDLSTIFRVIERIRCIVAEERIAAVYLPLLGAGKGGVAGDIAFHTIVSALLQARCSGGGHHLKEIHIIVYAPEGRPPQVDRGHVESYLKHLFALFRSA